VGAVSAAWVGEFGGILTVLSVSFFKEVAQMSFHKKLLVIDDESTFTSVISEYFEPFGFQILAAHSADQALKIFKKHRPKVALLDFRMPEITGEIFLRQLQAVDPKVRVIVVTGYTPGEVEDKFRGAGYFAFFEKLGLSLDNLKLKVEEALTY
jgi:DNA-binding NtrC family response regulator